MHSAAKTPPRSTARQPTWRATSPRTSSRRELAERCEIQLAYAIGVSEPVSVHVDTQGTGTLPDSLIAEVVRRSFRLNPSGIIKQLDLRRPIYRKTASGGHFGRSEPEFTWEKTDKANLLREAANTFAPSTLA